MYNYCITMFRPAGMCFKYFYNEHVLQSAFKSKIFEKYIHIHIYSYTLYSTLIHYRIDTL